MVNSLTTLTDDEALALGLDPIFGGGDPDNQMVEAMMASGDLPVQDKEGRPVISYKQYLDIRKFKGDVSRYAIRVFRTGVPNKTWLVQASKLRKWQSYGYTSVGEVVKGVTPKRRAQPSPNAPSVKIFYCSDKYPDCKRFFDKEKGLAFHWRKEHGEAPIKRARDVAKEVVIHDDEED